MFPEEWQKGLLVVLQEQEQGRQEQKQASQEARAVKKAAKTEKLG